MKSTKNQISFYHATLPQEIGIINLILRVKQNTEERKRDFHSVSL